VKSNKFQTECRTLELKIKEHTGINKARVYIIVGLIIAIIKLGRVNLKKIAPLINPKRSDRTNYRRLNKFFEKFSFDKKVRARLLGSFLPKGEKWILTMDRTNWKFGKANINFLVLGVAYKGMAIPLFWYLLDKRGNSNYGERIVIIEDFIEIFGLEKIDVLVADREFVGKKWFKWLKENKIPFVQRVMKNHKIKTAKGLVAVSSIFSHLAIGEHVTHAKKKTLYGYENLSIVAVKLNDEYLILATNLEPKYALSFYKRRWEIETLFSALKIRGFNLEETHMSNLQKLDTLFTILALAFVWSHSIGEWLNEKEPIKTLKHGRKAKSLFLYGLEYLARILLNSDYFSSELKFIFHMFHFKDLKIGDY
jgi:hypothetical protein